jgi:uncharacterized coiled-coil protein SlyX
MTDIPEQTPSRIELIEALLLQTADNLNRVTRQQKINTQAIAQLGDKIDQIGEKVDRLANRQERFQVQLKENVSELIQTIDYAVNSTEELIKRFLERKNSQYDRITRTTKPPRPYRIHARAHYPSTGNY